MADTTSSHTFHPRTHMTLNDTEIGHMRKNFAYVHPVNSKNDHNYHDSLIIIASFTLKMLFYR